MNENRFKYIQVFGIQTIKNFINIFMLCVWITFRLGEAEFSHSRAMWFFWHFSFYVYS